MSATGKPPVILILPSGRRHPMETNVVPRCGDTVQLAALTYVVRRVTCSYDAIDQTEDAYLVQLGAL